MRYKHQKAPAESVMLLENRALWVFENMHDKPGTSPDLPDNIFAMHSDVVEAKVYQLLQLFFTEEFCKRGFLHGFAVFVRDMKASGWKSSKWK